MRKQWTGTAATDGRIPEFVLKNILQNDIIIDVVRVGTTINNEKQFYGLFNLSLPQRCWSTDSQYLFFSTAQRANTKSYAVNIGQLFRLALVISPHN